ncbi:MAG: hypothetical protein ACJ8F3_07095 [Xanthobacteraceae bacterium]
MPLQFDRLPSRFPAGTRFVIEGRGTSKGRLRVEARYLEFPDGRHVDLTVPRTHSVPRRGGRRTARK